MLVIWGEETTAECRSKNLSEQSRNQQTQPIYLVKPKIWTLTTFNFVEGVCYHHCTFPTPCVDTEMKAEEGKSTSISPT